MQARCFRLRKEIAAVRTGMRPELTIIPDGELITQRDFQQSKLFADYDGARFVEIEWRGVSWRVFAIDLCDRGEVLFETGAARQSTSSESPSY